MFPELWREAKKRNMKKSGVMGFLSFRDRSVIKTEENVRINIIKRMQQNLFSVTLYI